MDPLDPILEPGMDPLIEEAMNRGNNLLVRNLEGKESVGLSPIIQIVIRGTVNVITGVPHSFRSADEMISSCMNAIMAAESGRARAAGYIFASPSDSLSPVDIPIAIPAPSIVVLGIDRNSWGKIIISQIGRNDDNLLVVTGIMEADGLGMFAGTIYDPWSTIQDE